MLKKIEKYLLDGLIFTGIVLPVVVGLTAIFGASVSAVDLSWLLVAKVAGVTMAGGFLLGTFDDIDAYIHSKKAAKHIVEENKTIAVSAEFKSELETEITKSNDKINNKQVQKISDSNTKDEDRQI